MKEILSGLILAFFLYSSASAQVAQNTWGFGAGIVSGGAVFHIPIIFEKIRLEPEIGIRSSSSNSSYTSYQYQAGYDTYSDSYTTNSTSQSFSFGTGLYYMCRIDAGFNCYFGPRAGISYTTSTTDRTDLYTDTTYVRTILDHVKQHSLGYFAGAVFGGEYNISSHLSLGAELQLTYTNSGQPTFVQTHSINPPPPNNTFTYDTTPTISTSSAFAATTAVYIRWYF